MKQRIDNKALTQYNILGVEVCGLTVIELHGLIEDYIRGQHKALILHVNVHCLNLCYRYHWLRGFLNQSQLAFCDGAGVMLGAKLLGYHIPERITYADWLWQLAAFAEPRQITFYFLGGRPGIAEKAAQQLQVRHPDLQIVGVHHGYFDKAIGSQENQAVIEQINAARPHILLVGFGMPVQEQLLRENWGEIDAHVALTGGAVFDYISGELRRAPRWMTDHGLEWLGRLIIEPRRLWQRYVVGNPIFLWRVLGQRLGWLKIES